MKFDNVKCLELNGLALADFTDGEDDGEDATGYIDGTYQLPAGAFPLFWEANITTAFVGTTSATMAVGTTTDADAFTAVTTNSVVAVAKKTSFALAPCTAADRAVRVTITDTKESDPDFGDFSAGELSLKLFYIESET